MNNKVVNIDWDTAVVRIWDEERDESVIVSFDVIREIYKQIGGCPRCNKLKEFMDLQG